MRAVRGGQHVLLRSMHDKCFDTAGEVERIAVVRISYAASHNRRFLMLRPQPLGPWLPKPLGSPGLPFPRAIPMRYAVGSIGSLLCASRSPTTALIPRCAPSSVCTQAQHIMGRL